MPVKEPHPMHENRSEPRESNQIRSAKGLDSQTEEPTGQIHPPIWLKPVNLAKPRILIVHDDDAISKELEVILLHAGLASERVRSMKAGCESAKSGRFQVILTTPVLEDGSWKRLAGIDSRYRPGFVIIVVASNFDLNEWGQALEDGAFDVLDALRELPLAAEAARRALWAAYLKGAGPRPEAPSPLNVT
jgi:DNA-binding NtrC family response regulator